MPCSCQPPKPSVLYQGDPNVLAKWRMFKESMQQVLSPHINKRVRITLEDGTMYEGTIVNVEGNFLYLQIAMPTPAVTLPPATAAATGDTVPPTPQYRAYGSYYSNVILPLVLFELLVITLL